MNLDIIQIRVIKKNSKRGVFIKRLIIFFICVLMLITINPFETNAAGVQETYSYYEDVELNTYMGVFKITHYCPCGICCGQWATNGPTYTASGARAYPNHTIAVDTRVFPFGTKVLINGHVYTAEDRGGAIKGNKIDIFCATHQDALNGGMYYTDVWRVDTVKVKRTITVKKEVQITKVVPINSELINTFRRTEGIQCIGLE